MRHHVNVRIIPPTEFSNMKKEYMDNLKTALNNSSVKNKEELKQNIKALISANGINCDLNSKVKTVLLGLSYACNLNCYHCFHNVHKDF